MPQMRIVAPQRQFLAARDPQPQGAGADPQHVGPLAVDQPPPVVVARPAERVPRPDADRARLEQVQPVAEVARRVDPPRLAVRMGQRHPAVLDPGHRTGLPGPDAERVEVVGEHRHVALPPVAGVALLRPRHAEIDQGVDLQFPPVQHAFLLQPLAHRVGDRRPQFAGRREDRRLRPVLRRQS